MALPRTPSNSWMENFDFPNRLVDSGRSEFELFEEDDEFVLSVELPGFDREEITVSWNDSVLNIAAEHEDPDRGQHKTYHRRFRFPKSVADEEISASYTNGILEVRLPVETEAGVTGTEIEIES